jgi:hypothetical protein
MKKLLIPFFAMVLAFGLNAFTVKPTGTFYKYTSTSHAQADIQNIANYSRVGASCVSGPNVCGVVLATNEGAGNPPDADEFAAESDNLWTSQQNGSAADGSIDMKN